MPPEISPLYLSVPITQQDKPNLFFIQQFSRLLAAVLSVSTLGEGYTASAQTAGKTGEPLQTTVVQALYRFTYYLDKTVADGVSSSLRVTLYWTENGQPRSHQFTNFTTDAAGANQSETLLFYCDASVGITFDLAYASNTPGAMTYDAWMRLEQMN